MSSSSQEGIGRRLSRLLRGTPSPSRVPVNAPSLAETAPMNVETEHHSLSSLVSALEAPMPPMRVKVKMLRVPRPADTADTSGRTVHGSTATPVVEESEGEEPSSHATLVERRFESIISDQTCEDLARASGSQSFRCRAPESFERPYNRRSGNLKGFALFQHSFEFGLRLPLCSFYQDICDILEVSPAQLAPNAWAMLCTFNIECRKIGKLPTAKVFFFFHTSQACREGDLITISFRHRNDKKIFDGLPNKIPDWRRYWCWAYGPLVPFINAPWRTSAPKAPKVPRLQAFSAPEQELIILLRSRANVGQLWSIIIVSSFQLLKEIGLVSELEWAEEGEELSPSEKSDSSDEYDEDGRPISTGPASSRAAGFRPPGLRRDGGSIRTFIGYLSHLVRFRLGQMVF
ncbi:hypothetical protein Dimus_038615 [Dionaea muscipula]